MQEFPNFGGHLVCVQILIIPMSKMLVFKPVNNNIKQKNNDSMAHKENTENLLSDKLLSLFSSSGLQHGTQK